MALQPAHYDDSLARPLSALVDDVVRSAQGVVVQSAELARLELAEGARRGALGVALLVTGSVCLGILAALFWGAFVLGLVWLAGDALGRPLAAFLVWAVHLAAAVAGGFWIRARIARDDLDAER
jgi:hypothetical protein